MKVKIAYAITTVALILSAFLIGRHTTNWAVTTRATLHNITFSLLEEN